jgi:hypothetical protein
MIFLSRVLFFSALLSSISATAKTWDFDVYLDKQKIGTHRFDYENGTLNSRADFNVKLLWVSAYRYQHQASEQWQGECLSKLSAQTQENKVKTLVDGQLQAQQFEINVNNKSLSLPACVMTFAYWNPSMRKQSKLLNPQNAEYLDVTFTAQGASSLKVRGQNTPTQVYLLKGRFEGNEKLNIRLWYDAQDEWVGLESTTPEGYKINYKLK